MPHLPLYASPAFEGKSNRGLYGDVIEELDWSVGQVLESLKKNGLTENTLVIFTSDNGPWTIFDIEGGSAGILRNGKGTTFEGGQRVPTVFQWPAKIKAGSVYEDLALHLDIFPTILKLAGYQAVLLNPIDGEDISSILTANGKRKGDEFIYYSNGKIEAFRKGDWKLRLAQPASKNYLNGETNPASEALLFNLKDDVSEKTNLYQTKPEKVAELLTALDKKVKTIGQNITTLPQRLPADDSHIKKYYQRHPELKK
jgi:arylsulfatase A-like enzyme